MYQVIMLRDGKRKELKKYYTIEEFTHKHPTIKVIIVGYIIYIHEKVK